MGQRGVGWRRSRHRGKSLPALELGSPRTRERPLTRRVFVGLSLGGVAVATWLVLTRSGPAPEALLALAPANHAAAFATTVVDTVLRAARLVVLGTVMGILIPLSASIRAHLAADGAAAVAPVRFGSDAAKALVLRRHHIRGGHIGALMVGEAVCEATMLLFCAAVLVLSPDVPLLATTGPLAWSLGNLALVAFAVRLAPSQDARAPRILTRLRISEQRWGRIKKIAADFREAAGRLRRMGRIHLALLALTTLGHIAARLLTLPALVGPGVALANPEPLFGWPFFLLYGGRLIPAPGGAGLIETGFAATVAGHVPDAQLGSLAFWWRFYTFHLVAIAGWLTFVAASGRRKRGGVDGGSMGDGRTTR